MLDSPQSKQYRDFSFTPQPKFSSMSPILKAKESYFLDSPKTADNCIKHFKFEVLPDDLTVASTDIKTLGVKEMLLDRLKLSMP